MNNAAEIKIKLHHKHINRTWLGKTIVYEPYLKTTKLGYWFIVLNTQKCGKLEVQTETSWFPQRQKS